ncbi:ArsR/SmtB family transcription factor [Bacillus sp. FJAT-45037]|uniref:ArsR/SmtB family transcription factor n=1 Tax=Bacillus sp. FJAT-45037 TaxID=2011007 RepID=UPI000C23B242|nr:metalloregulator ArsR/SmtB family transcription factor [Bacillus sp. FJAT-45037]
MKSEGDKVSKDTCDVYNFDINKVNSIQIMMESESIVSLAKLFKILGDENRAKISYALCKSNELCVCDIANIIGATVATTSHHLRTLDKAGIVTYRKEGKLAFYSLRNDSMGEFIMNTLNHVKEEMVNV